MENRIRAGLRIPYELNTWLIFKAKEHGMSKNALILQILWDWMKIEGKEQVLGCGRGVVREAEPT